VQLIKKTYVCATSHVKTQISTHEKSAPYYNSCEKSVLCTATHMLYSKQAANPWWFLGRDYLVLTNFALMNRAGSLVSTFGSPN